MPRTFLSRLLLAAALAAGAAAPSLSADDVDEKRLYRAKCSGCHRLHPKEELSSAEWRKRLPEMAKRAKLTPEQLEILVRYLSGPEAPPVVPTPVATPSHDGSATNR